MIRDVSSRPERKLARASGKGRKSVDVTGTDASLATAGSRTGPAE
jgi:hypothetical protein